MANKVGRPKGATVKGLERSKSFQKHYLKSVKHVKQWSNTPIEATKTLKLICLFVIGFSNIRLSDLPKTDLEGLTPQSLRIYLQILITLYSKGKASKTSCLKTTGLNTKNIKLIDEQLIVKGYVVEVKTKRKQVNYMARASMIDVKEIELTTKGYDFLNEIFKLILDEELF